jgi:hypothetical protein
MRGGAMKTFVVLLRVMTAIIWSTTAALADESFLVVAVPKVRPASVTMESHSELITDITATGGVAIFTSPAYPGVRHISLTIRSFGVYGGEYYFVRTYSQHMVNHGQSPWGVPGALESVSNNDLYTVEFDTTQWAIFALDQSTLDLEFSYTVTYPSP